MTRREKLEIDYYLGRIEEIKKDIINRTKRQNMWFESDCGYEIANNPRLKWFYGKLDALVSNL